MELQCTVCGTQLSTAFEGKAKARDWDLSRIVCHEHFDSIENPRLVPKEK